ncbi:MAG TPA: DEDD exonuclease domain-containing protein [Ilumatobacteraceae bacterium]|nr:DEDD exonuclease domain-containing protein [Ilumatobacteraceae bacterium]
MLQMSSRSIAELTQQRSFDDLGTPLHDVVFCVIDLETTGGNRNDDQITEVGAVKVQGGQCLGTFQTLVNPGRAIPPQITVLTGLSDVLVSAAPRIAAVLPSLIEFVGDAVIVGHNVGFDIGFLRAACERHGRAPLSGTVVDTVALARRLVRDEVPDCKLGTLASRLRLDHQPSHRALDDALATADLLHLLIERASGLGVLGLDDLLALAKLAGHPQAAKLKMTADLPRTPGVYMFRGQRDDVLYVGKATNLRQRVRSYFGSDDRRKIGPMLRETQSVTHLDLPDALTAEVIESRLIARLLPRYNRAGTRVDRYCYVRLDVDTPWPRLSVVKNPSATGMHLGPLPSRTMANLVVEAIQSAVPLRRCSARLGRNFNPAPDATACSAAQLGVAHCPCAGTADAAEYAQAVDHAAAALTGHPHRVVELLHDKMMQLAHQQRFEEAASVRDRVTALVGAAKRFHLVEALRHAERVEVTYGESTWTIERAQLVDAAKTACVSRALPIAAAEASGTGVLSRHQIDEALCLARFCDKRAAQLTVRCSGEWGFPISDRLPQLPGFATP